jgi:anti-anti-sigma factor
MNETPLEIDVVIEGTVARVTVRGDLTASRAAELEDRALPLLDGPVTRVELDLGGMPFLSSTGVAVLVRLSRRARQGKRQFAMFNPTAHIERMLRIAGLPIA